MGKVKRKIGVDGSEKGCLSLLHVASTGIGNRMAAGVVGRPVSIGFYRLPLVLLADFSKQCLK